MFLKQETEMFGRCEPRLLRYLADREIRFGEKESRLLQAVVGEISMNRDPFRLLEQTVEIVRMVVEFL